MYQGHVSCIDYLAFKSIYYALKYQYVGNTGYSLE